MRKKQCFGCERKEGGESICGDQNQQQATTPLLASALLRPPSLPPPPYRKSHLGPTPTSTPGNQGAPAGEMEDVRPTQPPPPSPTRRTSSNLAPTSPSLSTPGYQGVVVPEDYRSIKPSPTHRTSSNLAPTSPSLSTPGYQRVVVPEDYRSIQPSPTHRTSSNLAPTSPSLFTPGYQGVVVPTDVFRPAQPPPPSPALCRVQIEFKETDRPAGHPWQTAEERSGEQRPYFCCQITSLPVLLTHWLNHDKPTGADLILLSSDGRPFFTHKFLVGSRSSVLQDRIKRQEEAGNGGEYPHLQLHFPTSNTSVLETFVQFLYTEEKKGCRRLGDADLLSLLELALETYVPPLISECSALLSRIVKMESAVSINLLASAHQLAPLESISFQFILRNASHMFASDDLFKLDRETFSRILDNDLLNCTEVETFQAVVRWGKYWMNQSPQAKQPFSPVELRNFLEDVICRVRFPTMKPDEISRHVVPSGLLRPDEMVNLFTYVTLEEKERPPLILFSAESSSAGIIFAAGPAATTTTEGLSLYIPTNCDSNLTKPRNPPERTQFSSDSTNRYSTDAQPTVQASPTFVKRRWNGGNYTHHLLTKLTPTVGSANLTQFIGETVSCSKTSASGTAFVSPTPVVGQGNGGSCSDGATSSTQEVRGERGVEVDGTTTVADDRKEEDVSIDTNGSGGWDGEGDLFIPQKEKVNIKIESWEKWVRDKGKNVRFSSRKQAYGLKNAELCNYYTRAALPHLQQLTLDIHFEIPEGEHFSRYHRLFDVKRWLFSVKDLEAPWTLETLWDYALNVPVHISLCGVTMLKINRTKQELTINFRTDSKKILSGLGKSDGLLKLSLMKTDLPPTNNFPIKDLQQVVFYYVYGSTEVADFVRKCKSLEELALWIVVSDGQRYPELDLTRDLVSKKLNRLALSFLSLNFSPRTSIKPYLTELYLDQCFWPPSFSSHVHHLFPNLMKASFRTPAHIPYWSLVQDQQFPTSPQGGGGNGELSCSITVRLVVNVLKIESLDYLRVWGLDWEETLKTTSPGKALRARATPIEEEEVTELVHFLDRCKLKKSETNFLLQKDPRGGDEDWYGICLNENETKESDDGFWAYSDKLEFAFFQLDNFFASPSVFQDRFNTDLLEC